MEFPAMALFATRVISDGGLIRDNIIMIAFGLWMIHYVNRSLIFLLRLRTKGKKMPLLIVGLTFFFNLINGFVNGHWIGSLSPGYPVDWVYDLRFTIVAILFATGFFINQYHDNLLINLRKKNGQGYQIPYGGLVKYISTPNLFGEIIEWGSFVQFPGVYPPCRFLYGHLLTLFPGQSIITAGIKNNLKITLKNERQYFPFYFRIKKRY